MTQKELANKLGITDKAVSKWERGICCPDISLLDDLSKIFNVSVLEILKGRILDKDEKIENKDFIESMTYSKEQTKKEYLNIFNIICITVILVFVLLIFLYNIFSIYNFNRNYKTDFNYISTLNYDTQFNLILNNQGKFFNDDYKLIKNYIKILKLMQDESNKYKKDTITYFELIEYYKKISSYFSLITNDNIYDLLNRYKDIPSKVNNNILLGNIADEINAFYTDYNKILLYNTRLRVSSLETLYNFIDNTLSNILNDIIETGEISENN